MAVASNNEVKFCYSTELMFAQSFPLLYAGVKFSSLICVSSVSFCNTRYLILTRTRRSSAERSSRFYTKCQWILDIMSGSHRGGIIFSCFSQNVELRWCSKPIRIAKSLCVRVGHCTNETLRLKLIALFPRSVSDERKRKSFQKKHESLS